MGNAPALRSVSAVALALFFALCALAPAAASASFDDLPGEALGGDVPYESAAVFDETTPAFQTDGYTVEQPEIEFPLVYRACGEGRGTKDAWVRFDAGVTGNLFVSVSSHVPGDLFYMVWKSTTINPVFSDIHQIDCDDERNGPDEGSPAGYTIPAHTEVYVQVLVQCNSGEPCTPEQEAQAKGGETKVRLRFTPANADGDGFPDTTDRCPTLAGTFEGCPDSDGDGVGDGTDACPTVKGRAANGCPLPDEDGDGYDSIAAGGNDCDDGNSAIHPGATDVPGDGIDQNCDGRDSPTDADGDGYASIAYGGTDCNDGNAAIHPGANDVPGDGIDQNCDGHDAAFPVLHNEIGHELAYSPKQGRTIGFLKPFKIAGPLVPGMTVRLTCTGRGCPFSRQAVSVKGKEHGGLQIGKQLVRQSLAPGAAVTVIVTRPEYIGEAVRFTARKRGKMRIEELCVPAGTTTPEKQCT